MPSRPQPLHSSSLFQRRKVSQKAFEVHGYSDDFLIGEINNDISDDNQGPDIDVFLNNRTFNSGDNTFDSPVLIVDLQDDSGINKSGGIGHDIIAVLDDNQAEPIPLNSFFTTKLDDYTSGTIFFPMRDLDLGIHSLTVKAWDCLLYTSDAADE